MSGTAPTPSEEAQKEHLNNTVKCTLAPSAVHGIGVFAIRDIRKGERLYCVPEKPVRYQLKSLDGLREEIRELIIQRWPRAVHQEPFLSPNNDARLVSFMNHSDEPNYDPKTDLALRDIAQGEEILEDYALYKALLLDGERNNHPA